jgi:hypothetical protein
LFRKEKATCIKESFEAKNKSNCKTNHIWMRLKCAFQSNMRCLSAHEPDEIIILENEIS